MVYDCITLKTNLFNDQRGTFSELYKFSNLQNFVCKQVNFSSSHKGTLRGLHLAPYAKLVTCIAGQIFDVCIDLREDSPTYLKYFSARLGPNQNNNQIYIPANCAHGFLSVTDSVIVYAQDGEYSKDKDKAVCYKNYGVEWPENPTIISEKDSQVCKQNNR